MSWGYDEKFKPTTLMQYVAKWLADRQLPQKPERTSVVGLTPDFLSYGGYNVELELSAERIDIYTDMEQMDTLMPEVGRALDILADNAVNAREGTKRSFDIRFDEGRRVTKAVQKVILDMVERTDLQRLIYTFCRETIKYGDCFIQKIVSDKMRIEELMFMYQLSMRRNEDQTGHLKTGNKKGEWAFEQYEPRTDRFLAGFYPWQIEHVRWNRRGNSKYGTPALYTARYPFKKLQSMEEALVVNWLTRAFARLLFRLDTTGMSKPEAQRYLADFMKSLTRRDIASGAEGIERLTVAKDLAIGNGYINLGGTWEKALNDVTVLDTSNTGFWNIAAVEYWRNKLLMATGVPKAHIGVETDVNAKATLQWQDERFARTVRRVQMTMSELIHSLIDFELLLHGIDPQTVDYVVEWPTPSTMDEMDHSTAMRNFADAASILIDKGVVSPEWVASNWLKLTPAQMARVKSELAAIPKETDGNGAGEAKG